MNSISRYIGVALAALALSCGTAGAKSLIDTGIAGSNDHVYFWYADAGGQVSSGTTNSPTAHRGYYNFSGGNWGQLRAVGIAPNDRVYYWWVQPSTGIIVVTVGTTSDADAHGIDNSFTEPPNLTLLTAGIAKSTSRVYYYWRHNQTGQVTVTVGTSTYPIAYGSNPLNAATTLLNQDLVSVAIAGDDHVYFWWRDKSNGVITVTSGTSTDPFRYRGTPYASGL